MSKKEISKNKKSTDGKPKISIEDKYKSKSLHQHIIDLPDSYIGSIQNDIINLYVYDEEENKI